MTIEALGYINDSLESLNIPYNFDEWKDDIVFPFFVGEFIPIEPVNEDGMEEGTFIITGTSNTTILSLLEVSERIKELFPTDGKSAIMDSGSGIAVCYETTQPIPVEEQGLCRIQINLNVKEWRVN